MAETGQDTWSAARALFERVCELPPAQAEAALARAGHEDEVVSLARRLLHAERSGRVEQLAGALHELTPSLLRSEAGEAELRGALLGPWRIEAQIGAGGMGTVFRARREHGGFEETVAIKFMAGGGTAARFDVEKRALGRLGHPGIARILDAGTHPAWGPYLVMELVDGVPVDAWCRGGHTGARTCIALLLEVLDAVGHAHAQLVLHRDLKPSNILVTAAGRPVVLDFGLAKFLSAPLNSDGTALHAFTPRYASPEQLAREPLGVPSDIFAVAVVLYELLAGAHPFLPAGVDDAGTLMQRVLEGRCTPLRRALAQAAPEARHCRIDLAPSALRDLEAVLEHALQRRAADRYQSAGALGDELRRVLADRPVQVRRSSRLARAVRLARRHWPTAAALALAAVSLLAGAALAWTYALDAQRQRDQAIASAERARQLASVLTDAFSAPNPRRSRGEALSARDVLDQSAARIAADPVLVRDPVLAAGLEAVLADTYRSMGALEEADAQFERALQRIDGLDEPELQGRLLAGLGWLRAYQSRWEDAGRLLDQAVRLLARTDAHVLHVETLCRLATPLINQGRAEDAARALRQGIALADRHEAATGAGMACATSLAGAQLLQGRHEEAARQFQEVIARGGGDPAHATQVGSAYSSLGAVRARQGRFPEAAGHYQRAIALLSDAVGGGNSAVALARLGHAQALRGTGALEAAHAEFAAATAAYVAWFGEDNQAVAYARLLQAEFDYLRGQPVDAAAALADAADVLTRTGGETSMAACRARAVQHGVAAARGDPATAAALQPVLDCLSGDGAPPLARALAAVVAAERARAAGATDAADLLVRAAAAVRALPFADPLLEQRLAALDAAGADPPPR